MASLLIVTHADCLDGFTASRIYSWYLRTTGGIGHQLHWWNPNTPFTVDLTKYRHVIFVDCFPSYDVARQWSEYNKIHIIDHHKSTVDTLRRLQNDYPNWKTHTGAVDIDHCASELVCKVLSIREPWWVKHVADKDLWRWTHPNSKAITRALGSEYDFDALIGESQEVAEKRLIEAGLAAEASDALEIESLYASHIPILVSLENEWFTARLVRLPDGFRSWDILSELGEKLATDVYISLMLQPNGKLSCRSKREASGGPNEEQPNPKRQISSMDCNKFCQQLGGGGHVNSAGANFPALLESLDTEFTKPRAGRLAVYGADGNINGYIE